MNETYSKDTIDAKLDTIHETVKRIEVQTTKTNGRVTKLENGFNKWRYIVIGGLVVAGLMGAPNASVILKAFAGI